MFIIDNKISKIRYGEFDFMGPSKKRIANVNYTDKDVPVCTMMMLYHTKNNKLVSSAMCVNDVISYKE